MNKVYAVLNSDVEGSSIAAIATTFDTAKKLLLESPYRKSIDSLIEYRQSKEYLETYKESARTKLSSSAFILAIYEMPLDKLIYFSKRLYVYRFEDYEDIDEEVGDG